MSSESLSFGRHKTQAGRTSLLRSDVVGRISGRKRARKLGSPRRPTYRDGADSATRLSQILDSQANLDLVDPLDGCVRLSPYSGQVDGGHERLPVGGHVTARWRS